MTDCPHGRTFNVDDPICKECGDFDYCCLQLTEESNEDKWAKGKGRPKA